jgi:DNA polymerase
MAEQDDDNDAVDMPFEDLRAGHRISAGPPGRYSSVVPSMDFETYSEAGYDIDREAGTVKGTGNNSKGGLPVVGTPNYVTDPSAEILCLYYDLKDGLGRRAWLPGTPSPADLLAYIAGGGLIEAWNITFEFWVWNVIAVRRLGWPVLRLEQCRCVMAKSRRHSLPGALGKAAAVLGTQQKDKAGGSLIRKLTRPLKPTKNRKAYRWTPATAWDDFAALYAYCDIDVKTEDEAAAHIPDLTPDELATWQLDQIVNLRGVPVDMAALDACLDILGQTERKYSQELATITGGIVTAPSQLPAMQAWLAANGVDLPNMQKETIEEAIGVDLPPLPHRVLSIRAALGAANIKKLRTLKLQVSSDGRLRDQYTYCGADRTGRWSAGGVQLQNITAKGPKSAECEGCGEFFNPSAQQGRVVGIDVLNNTETRTTELLCPHCGSWQWHTMPGWTVEAVESAIKAILTRDLDHVENVWGDSIKVMCGCLRGLFAAEDGKDFVCVDFSAIEAVSAACLARCQWRIDVFAGHAKIYEESAARATGISFEEIMAYKKAHGQHHPARATIGKVRELAGGYGGWVGAWKNFGADAFMTDEEIKADVLKWRAESPEIEHMWGGQFLWCGPGKWDYRPELFGLEGCAIQAIQFPGKCFSYIDITYGMWDDVLYCRLPSGRFLTYHRPRLSSARDKLNRGPAYQITFEGYNSNSVKGPVGWFRMETYGGRLFENVNQAVATDIQSFALKNVEAAGYPLVMHTHDEGVAEVPEGTGSVEEMERIMAIRPEWAAWWPIRAAGWRHKRYQKD